MTVLAIPLIVFLPVFARNVFSGSADLYTLFWSVPARERYVAP